MTEMKLFTMKMQQATLHYERTLLRKYGKREREKKRFLLIK